MNLQSHIPTAGVLSQLAEPDWLLTRMLQSTTGVELWMEGALARVQFTDVEAALIGLLGRAEAPKRLMVTVPRCVAGHLLPLATYAVINHLVSRSSALPPGLHVMPLSAQRGILIASADRRVRDAFSQSTISFGSFRQSLSGLPLFRLRRDWKLDAITPPRQVLFQGLPRVIFYHYDQQVPIAPALGVDVLLADVTEVASSTAEERFRQLVDAIRPQRVVLVVNEMQDQLVTNLREQEHFFVLPLSRTEPGGAVASRLAAPGFAKGQALQPDSSSVTWVVLAGPTADTFANAHAVLTDADRALGSATSQPLNLAWRYFNALANVPVLLDRYEEFTSSRNAYYAPTRLRNRLGRIFWDAANPGERAALAPRWPAVLATLDELAAALRADNPKWDALLELVTRPGAAGRVVLANAMVVEAAQRELLLSYGWTASTSGDLVISTWSDLHVSSPAVAVTSFCTVGRRRRQLLWAVLGGQNCFVGYAHESRAQYVDIDRAITALRSRLAQHASLAAQQLKLGSTADMSANTDWLDVQEPTQTLPAPGRDRRRFEEALAAILDSESSSEEDHGTGAEELPIAHVEIRYVSGEIVTVARDLELTVLRRGSDDAELLYPDALRPGDMVAALAGDSLRDVFREAVTRTSHLTGVDMRPINHWRTAVDHLRDETRLSTTTLMVNLIRAAGCTRDPFTIRLWLNGLTLAPRDASDIATVLTVARDRNAAAWSEEIGREFEKLRAFRRLLGRRIRTRFARGRGEVASSRIDMELDELLEGARLFEVAEVTLSAC